MKITISVYWVRPGYVTEMKPLQMCNRLLLIQYYNMYIDTTDIIKYHYFINYRIMYYIQILIPYTHVIVDILIIK